MIWINLMLILVLATMMWLIPTISRATIRLGVSVPRDRVHDATVLAAIARYRTAGIIGTVAMVIITVWLRHSTLASFLATLATALLWTADFVICRRPILRTKREQRWYADKTVRISASLTGGRQRFDWLMIPHAFAACLVIASGIVLAKRYAQLPSRYPTHWNIAGQVDGWTSKSWATVLSVPIVALILTVVIGAMSLAMTARRTATLPDGNALESRQRDNSIRRVMALTMAALNIVVAIIMSSTALAPLAEVRSAYARLIKALTIGCIVMLIVIIAVCTIATARILAHDHKTRTTSAESPDDDAAWKLGLFYVNSEDPSIMVPKRSGIGLTINFGNPWGMLITAGLVVIAIVSIALPAIVN